MTEKQDSNEQANAGARSDLESQIAPRSFQKPRDVKLAVLALSLVACHCFMIVLLGYGSLVASFFPLVVLACLLVVPAAVIYLGLVLLIYWRKLKTKQRKVRGVLLAALLLVILLYFSSSLLLVYSPLADWGVRLRIARSGGVDRLQNWALSIMEKPVDQVVEEGSTINSIKKDVMSRQVRSLRASYVCIVPENENEQAHISIIWGGGFHHWGIFIGWPDFRMENNRLQRVYRWKDGVYGYHDTQ